MIELTVKTLDSQNHGFTVEDDITVAQFKEKIAETVNIPADTQRIIYCGRVLQDGSKLNEYDVNGKVVHLVQRPPPSTNQRPNQRSESPPPQPHPHRRIRGLEYLGSMRFPANAFDQNLMPPLPTHSLAASRLNVARRMLRRADAVLSALENPTARHAEQQPQEEPQEEVTPVFEARVIVPNVPNESIDEAVVLSAVQNSLLNATNAVPLNSTPVVPPENSASVEASDPAPQSNSDGEGPRSISSTPEVISPLATSSENLTTAGDEPGGSGGAPEEGETVNNTANNTNSTGNSTTENISRTSEYADLLDTLNRFHVRLQPFLEQYNEFMREDPAISPENTRATQAMINRVSEILHFLGHAYHSLSDIIVRVRTPPPRPLLCRPILIQHSAIVQAGIPIQVEAQINFSSDRNNSTTNGTAATTQPSNTATVNQQASTTTASSNTGTTITAHMQPTMVGFPLIPGTGVRVETFHLPQAANINLDRSNLNRNNNNNRDGTYVSVRSAADIIAQAAASAAASAAAAAVAASAGTTAASSNLEAIAIPISNSGGVGEPNDSTNRNSIVNAIASSVVDGLTAAAAANNVSGTAQATTGNSANNNAQVTINNPNVEFFMEVTPESITIDSLETSFVGANQANDILQGSLNPPPPELIQSIMQMAGQLINRGTQNAPGNVSSTTTSTTPTPSAPPSETTTSDSQGTATTNGGAARTIPFQNSQARGNTQTQPTTATHTRSTARPHVHLAQHAMQGFDPFLPCNSHHVTPRRRFPQPASASQQNANQQTQGNSTSNRAASEGSNEPRTIDQHNPFYNIMRSIINSVRTAYANQQGVPQTNPQSTTSPSSSSTGNGSNTTVHAPAWMSTLQNMNLSDSGFQRTPTIAQLLQQLPDDSYTEGESIFTDLIMLLSRNLTIGDVMHVNSGRLEPLMRIRTQLRNFFLYRILDGSQGTAAVDRGVARLLNEVQPFLDHLALLDTCDDIDIVRSVQTLLRARLPNIISLVASRSPNSLKMVVDQVRTTGRQFCALAVRASRNGRQGVENVFDLILSRYMQGIPRDLQQWTLMTSRAQMSMILSNLDVPESILQPYIVREVDAITPSIVDEQVVNSAGDNTSEPEPMQVEEETIVGAGGSTTDDLTVPPMNLADDPEPLPAVVLGSEPWHGQVPADWVPIIARDSQRQRRQNSQPPFSDAYLSGMPSKRRKIVANSKPQGSLPQVITESVRRAVTATGLSSVAPLESVAQAAGADINIQSAYRDLLRSSVQTGLRDNEDFTPERFPNASNYFNKHPQ